MRLNNNRKFLAFLASLAVQVINQSFPNKDVSRGYT